MNSDSQREAMALHGRTEPSSADRKVSLLKLCEELDALRVSNPTDGWSNRDHDAAIYVNEP